MRSRYIYYFLSVPLLVILLVSSALALDDIPPANSPFYGSGYVTGSSNELGNITLYFPISYKDGFLGTDSYGYLYNVSNTAITCYLEGQEYCNIPAWSYPRYREYNSSSWDYIDLHIVPEYSNCDVATQMEKRFTITELIPFAIVLLLGVLFVCFIKRS